MCLSLFSLVSPSLPLAVGAQEYVYALHTHAAVATGSPSGSMIVPVVLEAFVTDGGLRFPENAAGACCCQRLGPGSTRLPGYDDSACSWPC